MDDPHNFAVHLKTNAPRNSDLVVNVCRIGDPNKKGNSNQRRGNPATMHNL